MNNPHWCQSWKSHMGRPLVAPSMSGFVVVVNRNLSTTIWSTRCDEALAVRSCARTLLLKRKLGFCLSKLTSNLYKPNLKASRHLTGVWIGWWGEPERLAGRFFSPPTSLQDTWRSSLYSYDLLIHMKLGNVCTRAAARNSFKMCYMASDSQYPSRSMKPAFVDYNHKHKSFHYCVGVLLFARWRYQQGICCSALPVPRNT